MDVEVIEEAHVPDQPAKKYNFKRRKCSYGKPIQKKSKTYARYKQQREEEDEAENSADENVGMAPPPIRLDDDVPEVLTECWSISIISQMMPPVKKKKRADGNWRTDRAVQARDRQLENERKKREAERKAAQKKLDAQKKKRKAAEEKAKKASEKTAAMGEKLETEKKLRIAAEKKV